MALGEASRRGLGDRRNRPMLELRKTPPKSPPPSTRKSGAPQHEKLRRMAGEVLSGPSVSSAHGGSVYRESYEWSTRSSAFTPPAKLATVKGQLLADNSK
ncbi:MAG TPA: hypothetical protein DCE42_09060 [Myxococcales bacterium]|nr:hypothetical protein [Myxococcales bacterium]